MRLVSLLTLLQCHSVALHQQWNPNHTLWTQHPPGGQADGDGTGCHVEQ